MVKVALDCMCTDLQIKGLKLTWIKRLLTASEEWQDFSEGIIASYNKGFPWELDACRYLRALPCFIKALDRDELPDILLTPI